MADFKISGHMKVKTLKELFANEIGGTLRVYNGKKLADDDATLASIRSNEGAKGGDFTCRTSRTVGKFEQEIWDVYGIKVQVATADNWILVLDGITLSKVKDIPNYATKESMEAFVSYKRKAKDVEMEETCCTTQTEATQDSYYDEIIDMMEGQKLIYIPTFDINPDGVSLDNVDVECPDDAFNQINCVVGDYENGEISCAEESEHMDFNKDGVYLTCSTEYSNCWGGVAIAVLEGAIITAIWNDEDDRLLMRIGKDVFDTEEL